MTAPTYGPQDPFCDKLHAEKYRASGETFREAMTRVAQALRDDDEHFRTLREILLQMRFLPGGRIQAAVGSLRGITPYNCYVSGTIEDSYIDGSGSIMARAREAAATMRLGGGIGYDFSTLRPRGSLIRKLNSNSGGPIPFMEIFDAICRATSSSGHRRGAQMGVMRIDHPDIEDFIRAKQNTTALTGFNISVAVTDEFMTAVKEGTAFTLRWGGSEYKTVSAKVLWEALMRSTYDWAEPGILFIDRINAYNNLKYCETITATNPCGEQPLPPFGACLLGSFNLVKYLVKPSHEAGYKFDWVSFCYDIEFVVRAMDNVVDRAKYPLYEQEQEAQRKRRMGLGVTGVANTIEALGHPYGTSGFNRYLRAILDRLANTAYSASAKLAKEKGPFPAFDRDSYLRSPFVSDLEDETIELIRSYGIRNSHLLSIAPTGTISLAADNVSSGIEPVFAYKTDRTIVEFSGPRTYSVEDYGYRFLGTKGKTTAECTVKDHLGVLITASAKVDSAVSKTCNVPADCDWNEFQDIYMQAWEGGCKGCTTYRIGGKRGAILEAASEETAVAAQLSACEVDPVSGRISCE